MTPCTKWSGILATLNRANIDTDQILPKQFLTAVRRDGFGPALFHDWSQQPDGSRNPDFELNRPKCAGAIFLAVGRNFGCGSSREHAVWALQQHGFRAILSSSFAEIFKANCIENGLWPLELPEDRIQEIISAAGGDTPFSLTIDLPAQTIEAAGTTYAFSISPAAKQRLLLGQNAIERTLTRLAEMEAFEKTHNLQMYLSERVSP